MALHAIRKSIFIYLIILLGLQSTYGQEVVFLKGSATAKINDEISLLQKGSKLTYGTEITTGQNALLVIGFPSGSKLKVDPDTSIEIEDPISQEEGGKMNTMNLLRGSFIMEFARSHSEDSLIINKGNVAVAVRGTIFFVGEEQDEVYSAVKEGKITVLNKETKDFEDLSAGKSAFTEKSGSLTKPLAYEWQNGIDWDLQKPKEGSRFRNSEIRQKRRAEIKKRIKEFRERKKKVLPSHLKNRLELIKKRRQLRKEKASERREKLNSGRKKQAVEKQKKVQNFKERLKKKKLMRRRRN